MSELGKTFILLGAIFLIVGALLLIAGKISGLGRLPGDIIIKKENFTFYFPLTTSIVVSIILSLLFVLWNRR